MVEMSKQEKNTRLSWILLVVLSLLWGSNFLLMKRGIAVFSAPEMACLRISISGLALLPFLLIRWKSIQWPLYGKMLVFGVLNAGIPPFLFATAQHTISSSMAGILNALTPLFTLILGAAFFGTSIRLNYIFGVLLGLGGALLIIALRPGNGFEISSKVMLLAGMLIVFADLFYGISNNINKRYLQGADPLATAALAYGTMAIPALIYLFGFSDYTTRMAENPLAWPAMGYMLILGALGSALAMVLFTRLIQISNALFASYTTYLIPFIAVVWGLIDGESLGVGQIVGLGIILSGIYVSGRK